MEERTYISEKEASILYILIEKCETYYDAKTKLNDFVKEQLGKEYDGGFDLDEQGNITRLKYRNSNNPLEIKKRVTDAILRLADKSETVNKGVLEQCTKRTKKEEPQYIELIRDSLSRNRIVHDWIQEWREEPAIKIENEKFRFNPKSVSVRETAGKMFNYLVSIKRLESKDKEAWNYFCGMSENEVIPNPMIWHDELPSLCALMEVFFCNKINFGYKNGIIKYFVCKMFIQESGQPITESVFKSTKMQSKTNGGLEREMQLYCNNVGIFMPKENSKHEKLD